MNPEQGQNPALNLGVKEPDKVESAPVGEVAGSLIKKTPLMLKAEQKFAREGESIDGLLKRLYVDEEMTLLGIVRHFSGSGFKISHNSMSNWMRLLNPEVRIRSLEEMRRDPKARAYRLSRIRATYQDPERKKQAIARRNQTKGYINRRMPIRDDPQARLELIRKMSKTIRLKELKDRRVVLGPAPKKALKQMAEVEGLTVREITARVGRGEWTIRKWLKEFGISPRRINPPYLTRRHLPAPELDRRKQILDTVIERGLDKFLTLRQREVLLLLYPLEGDAPTQVMIANQLKMTRSAVQNFDKRGLAKLEKLLEGGPEALKKPTKTRNLLNHFLALGH